MADRSGRPADDSLAGLRRLQAGGRGANGRPSTESEFLASSRGSTSAVPPAQRIAGSGPDTAFRQVPAPGAGSAGSGGPSGGDPDAALPWPGGPVAPVRRGGRRGRRRRGRHRILKVTVGLLAFVVLAAGGLYGYVRYEWSKVHTVNCSACAAVDDSVPFNVLVVGSDSRADNVGNQSQAYGSQAEVGGQRSDTIKILHVDPSAGTASLLSIPRDTFVDLSGLPSGTELSTENKINAAFNNGPNGLVQTVEDTFGIPIQHVVVLDFNDVINLVNAVGGIQMNFPYPARDDDAGNNNSGLDVTTTGCQTLNGTEALALSRSRYFQYYDDGEWIADPTGDIGRIERQDLIIQAVIDKARSDYDPLTLNSFLTTVVRDVTVDDNMSFGTMLSLVERYHAFSATSLANHSYTLPTYPAENSYGDVEVVQEPQAQQVISTFLGTAPETAQTPPIDAYGNPQSTAPSSTGGAGASSPGTSGSGASAPGGTDTNSGVTPNQTPSYDPTPC